MTAVQSFSNPTADGWKLEINLSKFKTPKRSDRWGVLLEPSA